MQLSLLTSTGELQEYIAKLIHANIMDNVNKAVAEMDALYHSLGEKYFESYRVAARFGNGETWYEKIA